MRRAPILALAALLLVAPAPAAPPPQLQPMPAPARSAHDLFWSRARTLVVVADDFVVDVYLNGVKVPDDRRELVEEVHGATVERITLDVRPGDWLVFNVVNNRLRWGGASYFAVSARGDAGGAFTTELDSGRWSCCDDPDQVAAFIADRDHLAKHRALPIARPWSDGDALMAHHADGWTGKPLWGGSRNTWIKFIAR